MESNSSKEITHLSQICSGSEGFSAASLTTDIKLKNHKLNELKHILEGYEKKAAAGNEHEQFYYWLAIGYRNFISWFVRGDDRAQYFNKVVAHLERCISLNSQFIEAQIELGCILVDEKSVRNLDKSLLILSRLEEQNKLPQYAAISLSRARRWLGQPDSILNFSLLHLSNAYYPGSLRELRKNFRAFIRQLRKDNDVDMLKEALDKYYQTAVFVYLSYGSHDCNTGVAGRDTITAEIVLKQYLSDINQTYATHGIIEGGQFISESDWKVFKSTFGCVNKTLSLKRTQILKQSKEAYKRLLDDPVLYFAKSSD